MKGATMATRRTKALLLTELCCQQPHYMHHQRYLFVSLRTFESLQQQRQQQCGQQWSPLLRTPLRRQLLCPVVQQCQRHYTTMVTMATTTVKKGAESQVAEDNWECVIGLEVHAQIAAHTKLFSG